ncbi:hypothetical protein ACFL27_24870, partial [candidate division CSSED10-310 bacterium]
MKPWSKRKISYQLPNDLLGGGFCKPAVIKRNHVCIGTILPNRKNTDPNFIVSEFQSLPLKKEQPQIS